MMAQDIRRLRLRNQQIERTRFRSTGQLVAHMGAVQAQEYWGGKLGAGLRVARGTDAAVERAIGEREIVRTWPMRGTLHLVAAADVRWMLRLLTPRVVRGSAARYRQLGLDDVVFEHARRIIVKALEGGKAVTRRDLGRLLRENGIETMENRGGHIMSHLAQEGTIIFGPYDGKQATFVLLEEWVPPARCIEGEEAIVELTSRYFASHGPATLQDFCWWSGLTMKEAKLGVEGSKDTLINEDGYWLAPADGRPRASREAHLLPPFDEYTVAYRDRSAVVDPAFARLAANGGIFEPIVVIGGQVLGTWKRSVLEDGLSITVSPFDSLDATAWEAVGKAAQRQARFLGLPFAEMLVAQAPADRFGPNREPWTIDSFRAGPPTVR